MLCYVGPLLQNSPEPPMFIDLQCIYFDFNKILHEFIPPNEKYFTFTCNKLSGIQVKAS